MADWPMLLGLACRSAENDRQSPATFNSVQCTLAALVSHAVSLKFWGRIHDHACVNIITCEHNYIGTFAKLLASLGKLSKLSLVERMQVDMQDRLPDLACVLAALSEMPEFSHCPPQNTASYASQQFLQSTVLGLR